MDSVDRYASSVNDYGKSIAHSDQKLIVFNPGRQYREYDQHAINDVHLLAETADVDAEQWPWPLKIYTLSRFNLVRDGKKIEFSGKVQQKPLAMLKALIALGGRNVRASRIIDLLWPDMEQDISYQSFKTTLHRLRRLLDLDQAIQYQEGCLSMDQRFCWVDIWTFERLAGRVDALRAAHAPDSAPEEIARLTDRALALYSGNFLSADSVLPWAISTHERLRSKFIRLVVNAGYAWEKAGVWHKAAEYYQKGLEIDDLVEELYQRLLVCYFHLGKRAEAQVLFNRCRSVLAMQCIKPSVKTRATYEAIINE